MLQWQCKKKSFRHLTSEPSRQRAKSLSTQHNLLLLRRCRTTCCRLRSFMWCVATCWRMDACCLSVAAWLQLGAMSGIDIHRPVLRVMDQVVLLMWELPPLQQPSERVVVEDCLWSVLWWLANLLNSPMAHHIRHAPVRDANQTDGCSRPLTGTLLLLLFIALAKSKWHTTLVCRFCYTTSPNCKHEAVVVQLSVPLRSLLVALLRRQAA